MYFEVIYENGSHSIMQADSDSDALSGIKEQHRRAVNGERSLANDPSSPPAVRVKRVLVYDDHPGSLGEDQLVQSKDADKVLKDLAVGDLVSVPELVKSLRDLASPRLDSGPHESNFKMEEGRELDASEWEVAA